MKAVVAAFNQEKALVGAFSVITNLRMELFEALLNTATTAAVSEAEVSMLKFRRSRSSGTYSVTRPGQRQERHEDTGGPRDA